MTIHLELTKREIDLLQRAMRGLLIEEADSGLCLNGAYKPTKNFQAAEALENKLLAAFNAASDEAK